MADSVSWTDTSTRAEEGIGYEEIEFHFDHPHPLDANLWFYESEWILDLAWMNGGYEAGKKIEQRRERTDKISKEDVEGAQAWATFYIRPILIGVEERGTRTAS